MKPRNLKLYFQKENSDSLGKIPPHVNITGLFNVLEGTRLKDQKSDTDLLFKVWFPGCFYRKARKCFLRIDTSSREHVANHFAKERLDFASKTKTWDTNDI